jgi:ribose-phosphate pyrophosphokinase
MTLDPGAVSLLAPQCSRHLGEAVGQHLGVSLGGLEERGFEDGEHKARPLDPLRGKDVYVLHALYADATSRPDEKLCRLAFLIGSARDACAARVTAVVPYLCYARQERRTAAQDPVTTRYVAAMLEAVGADRVVTVHVHDRAAFENAFRIPSVDLSTTELFARALAPALDGPKELAVVSPDAGGVAAAERFREALEQVLHRTLASGFMSKLRGPTGLRGGAFAGDVTGRRAIVVDDMIASGATMIRAAEACRRHGAIGVYGVATHGLFTGDAGRVLSGPALDRVWVTDAVAPWRLGPELLRDKIEVVSIAPLLAECIAQLHGGSVELPP